MWDRVLKHSAKFTSVLKEKFTQKSKNVNKSSLKMAFLKTQIYSEQKVDLAEFYGFSGIRRMKYNIIMIIHPG